MGACLDLLRTAGATLLREANAVTDNPLVFAREGEVLSGGNFHAEPVAFAADQLALAVAEIGSIAERRIAILVDTKMSGLPAVPGRQQRRQLRLHGGAGDGRRAGLGKQIAGASRPASTAFRPPPTRKTTCRWPPTPRDACWPWPTTPPASSPSNCWLPRRGWIFIDRCAAPRPLEAVHRLLRRRVPVLSARPLLRARHRRGARRWSSAARCASTSTPRPVCALAERSSHRERSAAVQTFPTHTLLPGDSPLVISVPHAGTARAAGAGAAPYAAGAASCRTPTGTWPSSTISRPALGATMIVARYTRYLIDLNRPPDDAALYSAAAQTGLCPTQSFAGEPLYRDGTDAAHRRRNRRSAASNTGSPTTTRCARCWTTPRRGIWLRAAARCALDPQRRAAAVRRHAAGRQRRHLRRPLLRGRGHRRPCVAARRARRACTHVFDGRFKGGHITRHYGQPARAGRTRCRSNSRRAATWMSPARATTPRVPRHCASCCAAIVGVAAAVCGRRTA